MKYVIGMMRLTYIVSALRILLIYLKIPHID